MINYNQFQNEIILPLFTDMYNYSDAAVKAAMMCAAHESKGGTFLVQNVSDDYKAKYPKGYGLGVFQMEGWVHDDVWDESDNIVQDAIELGIIKDIHDIQKPERMIYDMRYAAFMFRKRLHMDTNPIPKSYVDISEYLKSFWNSGKGAATAEKYYLDWIDWRSGYSTTY